MIAPEDVRKGDYITVTQVTLEFPPSPCDEPWQAGGKPRRMSFMPFNAGDPMKVTAVCLPFVLVRHPSGLHDTLDLRRWDVARLSKDFADAAFRRMSPSACADRKPKKKKRKKGSKK